MKIIQTIKQHWAAALIFVWGLIGLIVTFVFPELTFRLIRISGDEISLNNLHTLFTYSFVQPSGLIGFMGMIIPVLLSSFLIGKKIPQNLLIVASILVVVTGGLIISIDQQTIGKGYAGFVMVSWLYAGAALMVGIRSWPLLRMISRIYAGLIVFSVLLLPIEPAGLLLNQVVGLNFGLMIGACIYESGSSKRFKFEFIPKV